MDVENSIRSKKLIFFFDGTANSAAEGRWADETNVFRMNLALEYAGNQIAFYMAGVATRGDVFSSYTGRGMDQIVREAYVNLASNYVRGDSIYIFGFSRGGACALALSQMISDVGLLWADNLDNLHAVWAYYVGYLGRRKLSDAARRDILERHIDGQVNKPNIRFLGLFDPVPGNAWDIFKKYSKIRLNRQIMLSDNIRAAVNILSIDDTRIPSFRPVVISKKASLEQSIEQIWIPGVQADIGGNSEAVFLSDAALLTMIERATFHCPELIWDEGYIERKEKSLGLRDSVIVSNERFDFKRELLWKWPRTIADKQDTNDRLSVNDMLHPLFDHLKGRELWVRSKWRRYNPPNVPRNMPRFSGGIYAKLFKESCETAFDYTMLVIEAIRRGPKRS